MLIFGTCNYHVFSIYWLSTGVLVPSVSHSLRGCWWLGPRRASRTYTMTTLSEWWGGFPGGSWNRWRPALINVHSFDMGWASMLTRKIWVHQFFIRQWSILGLLGRCCLTSWLLSMDRWSQVLGRAMTGIEQEVSWVDKVENEHTMLIAEA